MEARSRAAHQQVIKLTRVACVLVGAIGLASLVVVMAGALAPGYLYVITKHPRSRSPYCTAWDLARDFPIA
jgi:hypothetical protein